MDNKTIGLYPKYRVAKIVQHMGTDDHIEYELVDDWVFVLNPSTDPGAVFALNAYAVWAARNGYQQLSDEIRAKLGKEPYVPMVCGNED